MAQKPRPVLYHLQKPLKDWLDQGVREEIFKKVSAGEAITWWSPLVVQPIPKFTEMKSEEFESHMIRASINKRISNKSMKRSWCLQSPRVEDFIYRLQDLHEAGSQTRLLPLSSRPLHKTSSNIQHTLGELQTPTTGVRSKICTRCLRQSHVQNPQRHTPLLKPKRRHTPGRTRPNRT